MRHLLIAGVLVLASTTGSAAQAQLAPVNEELITLTFFEAPLEDAVSFIAKKTGITIEFDATVTEEVRHVPLANHRLRLLNVTIEQALDALTSVHGLTYTITGPKGRPHLEEGLIAQTGPNARNWRGLSLRIIFNVASGMPAFNSIGANTVTA
jgi:hypothetical protein